MAITWDFHAIDIDCYDDAFRWLIIVIIAAATLMPFRL